MEAGKGAVAMVAETMVATAGAARLVGLRVKAGKGAVTRAVVRWRRRGRRW